VAGTERKFSWATQRITELTHDLDKAQKHIKVGFCHNYLCSLQALQLLPIHKSSTTQCQPGLCQNATRVHVIICMQELEKALRANQEAETQLQHLRRQCADQEAAAATREVRCLLECQPVGMVNPRP